MEPNVATIYNASTGDTIADGLQSSIVCDQAINMARQIARARRKSVVVEDRPANQTYRITPAGNRIRPPKYWADWS